MFIRRTRELGFGSDGWVSPFSKHRSANRNKPDPEGEIIDRLPVPLLKYTIPRQTFIGTAVKTKSLEQDLRVFASL